MKHHIVHMAKPYGALWTLCHCTGSVPCTWARQVDFTTFKDANLPTSSKANLHLISWHVLCTQYEWKICRVAPHSHFFRRHVCIILHVNWNKQKKNTHHVAEWRVTPFDPKGGQYIFYIVKQRITHFAHVPQYSRGRQLPSPLCTCSKHNFVWICFQVNQSQNVLV